MGKDGWLGMETIVLQCITPSLTRMSSAFSLHIYGRKPRHLHVKCVSVALSLAKNTFFSLDWSEISSLKIAAMKIYIIQLNAYDLASALSYLHQLQ